MTQGRAEGELINTGLPYVVAQRKDHRARAVSSAESAVPVGAAQNYRRDVGERFDVVHRSWLSKQADSYWKGWFLSRPGFFSFDHLEHRGVFSGDVIVRRRHHFEIEAEITA